MGYQYLDEPFELHPKSSTKIDQVCSDLPPANDIRHSPQALLLVYDNDGRRRQAYKMLQTRYFDTVGFVHNLETLLIEASGTSKKFVALDVGGKNQSDLRVVGLLAESQPNVPILITADPDIMPFMKDIEQTSNNVHIIPKPIRIQALVSWVQKAGLNRAHQ